MFSHGPLNPNALVHQFLMIEDKHMQVINKKNCEQKTHVCNDCTYINNTRATMTHYSKHVNKVSASSDDSLPSLDLSCSPSVPN
jgi:hypothetical protein